MRKIAVSENRPESMRENEHLREHYPYTPTPKNVPTCTAENPYLATKSTPMNVCEEGETSQSRGSWQSTQA